MDFNINERPFEIEVDLRTPLLDLLRDHLGMTGTKKGCNQGACGACTVLVDGERINSCLALAVQYQGRVITTIEGLGAADGLHPMQRAFIEHDGFQCGYCTPGQICSSVGLAAPSRPRRLLQRADSESRSLRYSPAHSRSGSFPDATFEVSKIVTHLLECKRKRKNAFHHIYGKTQRETLAANCGERLRIAVKGLVYCIQRRRVVPND